MDKKMKSQHREIVISRLQQKILFRCMHDVQSPLIAVSGYLDLLELCLNDDKDLFKIERYRLQLKEGVEQVSQILKQIRYTYGREEENHPGGEPIEADVTWFLEEVVENASKLAKKKEQKIVLESEGKNLLLTTDLFLLQLFLYSTLISLLRFTSKKAVISVSISQEEDAVRIDFFSAEAERQADEILETILDRDKTERMASASESDGDSAGLAALELLDAAIQVEAPTPEAVRLRVRFKALGV